MDEASDFLAAMRDEIRRARANHENMNSAHEAYAVILEELDEFWDECRKKRESRSRSAMAQELVQIATMAWRAAVDLKVLAS